MRKIITYGVIIFQVILIISLVRGIQLAIAARSRVTKLEERKAELERQHEELEEKLSYVKSDYYVEKVAREELQMTKPGETMVIVPEGVLGETKVEESEEIREKTNLQKWWDVISGKIQ